MHGKPEPTPLGWPILPRHNQPFTPPAGAGAHFSTNPHEARANKSAFIGFYFQSPSGIFGFYFKGSAF
jgi:hypothetical protein